MDHHDHMNAEAEESPSHLGHEMSPTSAAPMAMEHDHRGMMEQDLPPRFVVVLQELVKLIPPTANRVRPDGSIEEVATARLVVGDVVLVRPREKVPIDGVVLEGESSANEALVTGEASPVPKREGDEVLGGT